jgi:hypothetical protein
MFIDLVGQRVMHGFAVYGQIDADMQHASFAVASKHV